MGKVATEFITLDASGQRLQAIGRCYGFALVPGKPRTAPRSVSLGSFPVQVRLRGGRIIDVVNDGGFYQSELIESADILGGNANEGFLVVTFDSPEEGARYSSGKTRASSTRVERGTAMPAGAPATVTDGFELRPGDRVLQFYFEGAANQVDLYQMALDGTWLLAESAFVDAAEARPVVRVRLVNGAIGRLSLKSAGGTVGLDVEQEAG